MAKTHCKRTGCGNWFNAGATTNEVQKYGYCSWGCLEAADPALAKELKEKASASRKAAVAVLLAVCAAIFAGIRWFLRQRTENPERFERLAAKWGVVLAVVVVLGTIFGIGGAQGTVDAVIADSCWSVRAKYEQEIEYKADKAKDPERFAKATDLKALAKAGVKCPGGESYEIREWKNKFDGSIHPTLFCPVHTPMRATNHDNEKE